MTVGSTYGTMPYGAGPYGGVFPGADYVGPQVINISPAPGSTNANPKPTIEFDVIDYEGNLNAASVKARVNGLTVFDNGQPQKFFSAWTGSVTVLSNGIHVVMTAPDFLGDAAPVTVLVTASDVSDNRVKKTWGFTTYAAVEITQVRVLSDRCVELTFAPGILVDGELFRTSNYACAVRLGYAKPVYAGQVTPPSSTPNAIVNAVVVCMRDYFSLNGRYGVRVQGVHDEFGRVVDTSSIFNAG